MTNNIKDKKDRFDFYKQLFFSYELHHTKDTDVKLNFINSILNKSNKDFDINRVNKRHLELIKDYTLYPFIFLWSTLSSIKGSPSLLIQYYLYELGYERYQELIEAVIYEDITYLKSDCFRDYLIYDNKGGRWVFEKNEDLISLYLNNRSLSNFLLENRFNFLSLSTL